MLKELIKLFIRTNGRKPNKLELLQLKFKAAQQSGKGEVIEFPRDKITDWTKPRPTTGKKADVVSSGIGKKAETAKKMDEDKFVADFMANADRIYYKFVNETLVKVQNASKDEQLKIAKDIINRKGMYRNLDEKDSAKILKSIDQNIKPVEPKAYGGLAGMLGEPTYQDDNHRVPYRKGKRVTMGQPSDVTTSGLLDINFDNLDLEEWFDILRSLGVSEHASGGRVPFKLGGKLVFDAARRKFLELMGGAAAGTVAAKSGLLNIFKGGKKQVVKELTSVPIKDISGMPAWFKPLVNKVIKEGTEIPSGAERVIVHKTKLPSSKTDVYVNQHLDTGDVTVDIGIDKHGFPDGKFGQPVRLEYKASEEIPLVAQSKGKKGSTKTKEEFNVEEAEFTGGHPENVKFEEVSVNKFGKHESDFREVEKFATGKNTVTGQFGKDKAAYERNISSLQKQDEDLADVFSNYPTPDDFASGGRVPLGKGKIALSKLDEGIAYLRKKFGKDIIKKGELSKPMAPQTELKRSIAGFQERQNITKELESFRGQIDDNIIKEISAMEPAQQLKAIEEVKFFIKSRKNLKQLKMTPEEELRKEFPGISDKLIRQILTDKNPQRIAEVKATLHEAMRMQDKGMGHQEIINIFKNMKRTKNATGGRVSLSSGGVAGMLGE